MVLITALPSGSLWNIMRRSSLSGPALLALSALLSAAPAFAESTPVVTDDHPVAWHRREEAERKKQAELERKREAEKKRKAEAKRERRRRKKDQPPVPAEAGEVDSTEDDAREL